MRDIENEPMWLVPPREYVEYAKKEAYLRELQMIRDIEESPIGLHEPLGCITELIKLEEQDKISHSQEQDSP